MEPYFKCVPTNSNAFFAAAGNGGSIAASIATVVVCLLGLVFRHCVGNDNYLLHGCVGWRRYAGEKGDAATGKVFVVADSSPSDEAIGSVDDLSSSKNDPRNNLLKEMIGMRESGMSSHGSGIGKINGSLDEKDSFLTSNQLPFQRKPGSGGGGSGGGGGVSSTSDPRAGSLKGVMVRVGEDEENFNGGLGAGAGGGGGGKDGEVGCGDEIEIEMATRSRYLGNGGHDAVAFTPQEQTTRIRELEALVKLHENELIDLRVMVQSLILMHTKQDKDQYI